MNALDNPVETWTENTPRDWAHGSWLVDDLRIATSYLSGHAVTPNLTRNVFLVNIGANDTSPVRADWKSDAQVIIDALVAKWSDAEIFLAKPWHRGGDVQCDSIAVWIDELIATNPTTCFAGHDERTWLEGGDDGATMTSDGWHYTAAGQAECVNQWKTILGY